MHGTPQQGSQHTPYAHSDLPQAAFTRDGERIVVVSRTGVRVWDLKPVPRPTDQLVLHARVLSGSMIDPTGAQVPLDTDTLRTAWEALRE